MLRWSEGSTSSIDGFVILAIMDFAFSYVTFAILGSHKIFLLYLSFNLKFPFFYYSRSIQLSLCVLLLGVGIATVTDLQLNFLGSILSLLAVLTTCVAQIVSL